MRGARTGDPLAQLAQQGDAAAAAGARTGGADDPPDAVGTGLEDLLDAGVVDAVAVAHQHGAALSDGADEAVRAT
jgi:hypothetical protein